MPALNTMIEPETARRAPSRARCRRTSCGRHPPPRTSADCRAFATRSSPTPTTPRRSTSAGSRSGRAATAAPPCARLSGSAPDPPDADPLVISAAVSAPGFSAVGVSYPVYVSASSPALARQHRTRRPTRGLLAERSWRKPSCSVRERSPWYRIGARRPAGRARPALEPIRSASTPSHVPPSGRWADPPFEPRRHHPRRFRTATPRCHE